MSAARISPVILEEQSMDASPDPAHELAGVLRIEAALRAAHQDDLEWQSADGQRHEWTWSIKALPRPPLVPRQTSR